MSEETIEIRAVISFLWKKGYDNIRIHDEIIQTYGENAITLRGVQKRTKSLNDGNHSIFDKERPGRPLKSNLAVQISAKLSENPYMTTKQIALAINSDSKTVKRVLTNEMNMINVNFKWIPHILTDEIRQNRVEIAQKMLDFLSNASEYVLNTVYTEDETWVYFENTRKSMWILQGTEIPSIPRRVIGSKKAMIAVIWSRTGIKSITMLGQQEKFTKEFFIKNVLRDLKKKYQVKDKILHMDNAKPHLVNDYLSKIGMKRLEHPAYSPDIAPSDFFLFGYLSFRLEGCFFATEKELFLKISEIMASIPSYMFKEAFNEWIRRLQLVIDLEGQYIK